MKLTPFKPDHDTHHDHDERQQELADAAHHQELRRGQADAPVFLILGTDRDQVFVGSEPVDYVLGQVDIAVAHHLYERVRGPARVAYDYEAALAVGLVGIVGARRGEHERTSLVFVGINSNLRRAEIVSRKAVGRRGEQFADGRVRPILNFERPRHREAGSGSGQVVHNGVRLIIRHEWNLGPETRKLPERVLVEHQILVHSNAPALQQRVERVVIAGLFAPDFDWRIQHYQRPSAVLDVLLDRVHFRLDVVAARPADYDQRTVARNLRFF